MANLVTRHMESMAEEIAEMRRTGLYSDEQTKFILKKRRNFEYKINGVAKNLQDFKEYIQFEKMLIKQIRVRRNKNKIAEKKSSIEYRILKRIKNLYEIAIQRFSNDFPLYLAYFKFCTQFSFNGAASMAVQTMIKNFSHNPEVWQMASAWHAYERKDISEALNVLHKGLVIHKSCQILYTEAVKLELLDVKNANGASDPDREEELSNEEVACKKIGIYIQSIFKNILYFNYYIDLLKLLEEYEYTRSVQDTIIKKLLDDHCDEETVWDVLAQREKNGFHYDLGTETPKPSTKYRVERCVKRYEEGLKKIPSSKRSALWNLYLDCMVELQTNSTSATIIKGNTLKNALENAASEITLSEKYYIAWIELVKKEECLDEILEKATNALSQSVELWKLRLKYTIMKQSISAINWVFKAGVEALKEKASSLWLMLIRYHCLVSSYEVINSIYEGGLMEPKAVSEVLKPLYIQWIVTSKDVTEARRVYSSIALQEPYCKKLHEAMAKIESIQLEPNFKAHEKVHQLACEQFGHEEIDVWINYINFYIVSVEDYNVKVESIRRKAETVLPPLLKSNFKEMFQRLSIQFNFSI